MNSCKDTGRVIISFHFPKCAGTTLRHFWQAAYNNVFLYDPIYRRKHRKQLHDNAPPHVVHGHMLYGMHVIFKVPCEYVTVMRDPVTRFVSHWLHWVEWGREARFQEIKDNSLEWFLDHPYTVEISNTMTWYLSGRKPTCQATFDLARRRLDTFALIGILDYFPAFLQALRDRYEIDVPDPEERKMELQSDTRCAEKTAHVRDRLEEMNSWDIRLYQEFQDRAPR